MNLVLPIRSIVKSSSLIGFLPMKKGKINTRSNKEDKNRLN